jgi:methionine aminopeptidase
MQPASLTGYRRVQSAARQVLANMQGCIRPGMTEVGIIDLCDRMQRQLGVERYWYNDLPAVVLVGARTPVTFAAPYIPSCEVVQQDDLVTIDLNPEIGGYWGDCARSYFIEAGQVQIRPVLNPEFVAGYMAEQSLHAWLQTQAKPEMTCDQLACLIDRQIEQAGFERLDEFAHSISCNQAGLRFVQRGDTTPLQALGLFTLEPHLRLPGGRYGFKQEEIYYFEGRQLKCL